MNRRHIRHNGMDGMNAESVINPNPGQAAPTENGVAGNAMQYGDRGSHGGNGGRGIRCERLVIYDSINTFIYGGNAGTGGSAGKKGKNVNVSQINVNLAALDGSAGAYGYKGYGGEGGERGDMGGTDAEVEPKAESGKDGEGAERP